MSKKTGQKAKDRAKKVRKIILERREEIRAALRKEKLDQKAAREAQKIANRVDGKTIINRSPEDQKALLQRNLDILKALDDQQKFLEQEQLKSSSVNEQHERARGIKQSAEVTFIPNPETNEPLKEPVADLKPTVDNVINTVSELLEDKVVDSAATKLAETLQNLSKKRSMSIKK
jgi:hypothetical protein